MTNIHDTVLKENQKQNKKLKKGSSGLSFIKNIQFIL